ncbi:MAG: class I SAM-dependent methyltransferase [Clostridia bacterium]|nr:class I SAM-dependent methyltransferase [Clostridia bacterium]
MKNGNLDGRLLSAAGFVRQGAVFADIGTDHAYLPLFLLNEGRITRAACADSAAAPSQHAVAHAKNSPYYEKMSFHLTNGLHGLDGQGITDIAVCGMGGELIRDILSAAPWIKNGDVRLILQPMSKQETLRRWLCENGFALSGEAYSFADGKYYLTILAGYTGEPRTLTEEEALMGSATKERLRNDTAAFGYFTRKRNALVKAVTGKNTSGENDCSEKRLLAALDNAFPDLAGRKDLL